MKSYLFILACLFTSSLSIFIPEDPIIDPKFKIPEKDGKCRALALRGGGTKGAYEVGALKAMVELMQPLEYAYDVVVGVSIGAINAGLLSLWKRGHEKYAVKYLEDVWSNNAIADFWENWPYLGFVEGLWRQSVLDNSKMQQLFKNVIGDKKFQRSIAIQSVDLNTGEFVIFDEETSPDLIVDSLISSGSIPFFFTPVKLNNSVLVDGGVFTNLDMSEAIIKCKDLGYKEENIIVDVVMCFDKVVDIESWSMDQSKYKNAYELYKRQNDFRDFYYYYEDITRVVRGYPHVNFRHLISPRKDLGGGYIPIFDGVDVIQGYIKQGYEDTKLNLEYYFKHFPQHQANTSSNATSNSTSPKVKSSVDDQEIKIKYGLNFQEIRTLINEGII